MRRRAGCSEPERAHRHYLSPSPPGALLSRRNAPELILAHRCPCSRSGVSRRGLQILPLSLADLNPLPPPPRSTHLLANLTCAGRGQSSSDCHLGSIAALLQSARGHRVTGVISRKYRIVVICSGALSVRSSDFRKRLVFINQNLFIVILSIRVTSRWIFIDICSDK